MMMINKFSFKKIKEKALDIFIYIVVFFSMFTTESLFLAYGGMTEYYIRMFIPIFLGLGAFVFFIVKRNFIFDMRFFIMLAILLICFFSSMFQGSGKGMLLSYIFITIFAYVFTEMLDFGKYIKIYKNIIMIQSIACLILFVIIQFNLPIASKIPKVSLQNPTTRELSEYYTIFIASLYPNAYGGFYRSIGMVWEPGILQAFLNLALIFEFAMPESNDKLRTFRIILIVLTIATTFSTTGIIVMACIFLYYFLKGYKSSSHKNLSRLGFIVVAFFIASFIFQDEAVFNKIFGKLMEENRGGSFNSRFASLVGNMKIFLDNPFFGAGLGTSTVDLQSFSSTHAAGEYIHQTNTMTNYFSSFGIFAGLYYISGWFKFSFRIDKNGIYPLMIFLIFVLMTSSENFLPSLFFNIIVFYGINDKGYYQNNSKLKFVLKN